MIKIAFIIMLLFSIFTILLFLSFILYLNKRRKELLIEIENQKQLFNNATEEINRLSIQLIKLKRHLNLNDIILDINVILDKINKIGYVNLSQKEKDYLNNYE